MEALRQELFERERNIDALASTPVTSRFAYPEKGVSVLSAIPPEGMEWGSHYAQGDNVYHYATGPCRTKIGEMPELVERSFFDGAIEVLNAVIRSTSHDATLVVEGQGTRKSRAMLEELRADILARHSFI